MKLSRRGLFGLPLALPGAVIGAAAVTATVDVRNNAGGATAFTATSAFSRGHLQIDVLIKTVEDRVASRLAHYGLRPVGR